MSPASPLLVAYYSRSGATARAGHALAQRLDADEHVIEDLRGDGQVSVWTATLDRLLGRLPPITEAPVPLDGYDMVVLGTPIWGGRAASPVNRFLHDNASRLPEVAFFCTMGGSGADKAFVDMQRRLGKNPRAVCALDAKAMADDGYLDTLDRFATQLAAAQPPHRVASNGFRVSS